MAYVRSYTENGQRLRSIQQRLSALTKAYASVGAMVDLRRSQLEGDALIEQDAQASLDALADDAAAIANDLTEINFTHQYRVDGNRPFDSQGLSMKPSTDTIRRVAGVEPATNDDVTAYVAVGDTIMLRNSGDNNGLYEVTGVLTDGVEVGALAGTENLNDEDAVFVLYAR